MSIVVISVVIIIIIIVVAIALRVVFRLWQMISPMVVTIYTAQAFRPVVSSLVPWVSEIPFMLETRLMYWLALENSVRIGFPEFAPGGVPGLSVPFLRMSRVCQLPPEACSIASRV